MGYCWENVRDVATFRCTAEMSSAHGKHDSLLDIALVAGLVAPHTHWSSSAWTRARRCRGCASLGYRRARASPRGGGRRGSDRNRAVVARDGLREPAELMRHESAMSVCSAIPRFECERMSGDPEGPIQALADDAWGRSSRASPGHCAAPYCGSPDVVADWRARRHGKPRDSTTVAGLSAFNKSARPQSVTPVNRPRTAGMLRLDPCGCKSRRVRAAGDPQKSREASAIREHQPNQRPRAPPHSQKTGRFRGP